jgi:hypothetical protein
MKLVHYLRRHRLRAALLLTLFGSLAAGLFAAAKAQSQECRVAENIKVCADRFASSGINPEAFHAYGNLRLGPKDGEPVVLVKDISGFPGAEQHFREAWFFYKRDKDALYGNNALLRGDVHFIKDATGRPLIRTIFADSDKPDPLEYGIFFVDTAGQAIVLPKAGESPYLEAQNVPRNTAFSFPVLQRSGLLALGKTDPTRIEARLSLAARSLGVEVPIRVELEGDERAQPAESENVATIAVSENGTLSTGLSSFKVGMAGMVGLVKGVKITPPAGACGDPGAPCPTATPGAPFPEVELLEPDFEIDSIEFRKADNPALPNLDPSDPGLIFKIDGVRYKDGRFSLAASTRIRDWRVGNAFQLANQTIGIGYDSSRKQYGLTISSTLSFAGAGGVVTDTTRYPITMRMRLKETLGGNGITTALSATLGTARLNLGVGPLRIRPQSVGLLFDPEQDFYGLTAERVAFQWGVDAGGQSGPDIAGFRLGVDKDKNLKFSMGAGGTLDLPDFRTGALTGSFRGSIAALDNRLEARLDGALRVALPGNFGLVPTATLTLRRGTGVVESCPPNQPGCLQAVDFKLAAFDIKLAGFTLALQNPRGFGGGFAADRVLLRPPAGMSFAGGEVRGLKVNGKGDVSFDGGGISLPPIRLGKIQFADVKGFFARSAAGYEFRAEGTLPLPGLTGKQIGGAAGREGKQIRAQLTIRTQPTGAISSLGVTVDFKTGSPGIVIGSTGMELLEIGGRFNLDSNTVKVGVRMKAGSQLRVGNLPVVSLNGDAELQFNPTRFKANAALSVLVVDVARASMGIGAGEGFNGGDGFNVAFELDFVVVHGEVKLRLGKVQLSNGKQELRVAASAIFSVGIKKDSIVKFIPPRDLDLAEVTLKGGHFKDKDGRETLGLMGTVSCCIFYDDTIFVDLRTGKVSFPDPKNYTLLGDEKVAARAARGERGFQLRAMTSPELRAMGIDEARAARAGQPLTFVTIPFTVTQAGTTLFGLSYPAPSAAGHPLLSLQGPNGFAVGERSVDNRTTSLISDTLTPADGHDKAIVVKDAAPGVYILTIVNAPADYEQVSYTLSAPPRIEALEARCSPQQPGIDPYPLVATRCDGAMSGDGVSVNFKVSDPDSPQLNAYVGYLPLPAPGEELDMAAMRLIAERLPIGAGNQPFNVSAIWGTQDVPSGRYQIVVGVSDGQHAPVEVAAELIVEVRDQQPPEQVGLMLAEARPGAVLVRWDAALARDVAGYEVGFGPTGDPAQFVYTRDLGEVEPPAADELLEATLWGIEDNQEVFVSVRAYDQDGNFGPWKAPASARPWPLAPDALLPLPGGQAYPDTAVRLLFDTPLAPETVIDRLALKRLDGGAEVPGTSEIIRSLDGSQALGLRFVPAQPLELGASYEATIKGGGDGMMAADGRSMPADYWWRFTVVLPPADPAAGGMVPPEPEALAVPAEGGDPGSLGPAEPPVDQPPAEQPGELPAGRRAVALPLLLR